VSKNNTWTNVYREPCSNAEDISTTDNGIAVLSNDPWKIQTIELFDSPIHVIATHYLEHVTPIPDPRITLSNETVYLLTHKKVNNELNLTTLSQTKIVNEPVKWSKHITKPDPIIGMKVEVVAENDSIWIVGNHKAYFASRDDSHTWLVQNEVPLCTSKNIMGTVLTKTHLYVACEPTDENKQEGTVVQISNYSRSKKKTHIFSNVRIIGLSNTHQPRTKEEGKVEVLTLQCNKTHYGATLILTEYDDSGKKWINEGKYTYASYNNQLNYTDQVIGFTSGTDSIYTYNQKKKQIMRLNRRDHRHTWESISSTQNLLIVLLPDRTSTPEDSPDEYLPFVTIREEEASNQLSIYRTGSAARHEEEEKRTKDKKESGAKK